MTIKVLNSTVPRDHLVIPDAHTHPNDNPRRFEWLAELILERQPEVIVQIGDWWDMGSLSSYDQGKKAFVFQNLKEDIDTGHAMEEILYAPVAQMNARLARNKKKQYQPVVIKCLGNHEIRVGKLLQYEPRWEGTISMNDFNTRIAWLDETVVPFMDTIIVDGVAYSHYFVSGVMGRPVSSARSLLTKKMMSCTMGHVHVIDGAEGVKPDGTSARSLICGSFHDKEHVGFGGPQVDQTYWNGVIYKHGVFNGDYDREEISVTRLEREFEEQ